MWINVENQIFPLCLQTCLFNTCNIIYITMPLLKIFVIVLNKKDFFHLIFYTEKHFYKDNYDEHEQRIFTNCRRQCIIFVCFLTFSTKGTLVCYIVSPLVGELFKIYKLLLYIYKLLLYISYYYLRYIRYIYI